MCMLMARANSGPVEGFTQHVAEEGQELTKEQRAENWALGGAENPYGQVRNNPLGFFAQDLAKQQIRNKYFERMEAQKEAEWRSSYDSLKISNYDEKPKTETEKPKKKIFYGDTGIQGGEYWGQQK